MREELTMFGRPVQQRYALPDGSYPTPNINDLLIVETITLRADQVEAILPGTPHPIVATARLLTQKELANDGIDTTVQRVYVTDRAAQDSHNYRISYAENDTDYPAFVRSYLELRTAYTPATPKTALGKVYRLAITAGGTGYKEVPTVSFSGGDGTGVTATAEVLDGVVAALLLTNCGSGYTSAPTITISGGGGTGATATATIQTTTCLLVEETAEPAPGELSNLYLMVMRVYETLPGRASYAAAGWEPETGLALLTKRQRVLQVADPITILPDWGDTATVGALGYIVYDAQVQQVNANVAEVVTQLIDDTIDGFDRTDIQSIGFQFPAIFEYIIGYYSGVLPGFTRRAPFPGVNYDLSAHRTASKPAEVTYTYSIGPSGTVPNTWMVTTPGTASREFPIGQNTLHDAFVVDEYKVDLVTFQTIENIPVSTPTKASYTPGTTECIIRASEERWKGPIFRKVVASVVE